MQFAVVSLIVWSWLLITGIEASNSSQSDSPNIQLVRTDNSGWAAEVFHNGSWNRICSDESDPSLALTLCKQMLHPSGRLRTGVNSTHQLLVVEFDDCITDAPDINGCSIEVEEDDECVSGEELVVECYDDYLTFLSPFYYSPRVMFVTRRNTGVITVNSTFTPHIPYSTGQTFNNIHVYPHGVMSLNAKLMLNTSRQFSDMPVLAPFWTETIRNSGFNVRVAVYQRNITATTGQNYFTIVNRFVSNRTHTQFSGDWLMIAKWNDVRFPTSPNNQYFYQAVVITDQVRTYAVFTYKCSMDLPINTPALIGISVPNAVKQFRYSSLNLTSHVGCLNQPRSDYYNLLYSLSAENSSEPNETGSCIAAGFDVASCCKTLTDPTHQCRVGSGEGACYCDGLCIQRNDCCDDFQLSMLRPCISVCDDNATRLVSAPSGQLEHPQICVNGVWLFICDLSWNNAIARIFCQLLGDDVQTVVTTLSPFQFGINRVICEDNGGERSCHIGTMANNTCSNFLSIDCQGNGSTVHDADVPATMQPVNSSIIQHTISATPSLQLATNGSPTPAVPAPTETAVHSSSPVAHVVPDSGIVGALTTVIVVLGIVALVSLVTCIFHKISVKRRHRHEAVCSLPSMDTPDVSNKPVLTLNNDYVERGRGSLIRPEHIPMVSHKFIVLNKQLRLIDPIGQGDFGMVYTAHLFENGEKTLVAVKTLKGSFDETQVHEMIQESVRMKELQHSNVMSLLGVCLDGGPAPLLVLPYMENGSVLDYLKINRSALVIGKDSEEEVEVTTVQTKLLTMCLQIAQGMEYLADQNLVHRDLAARNCMIDKTGVIKVADFGLAKNTYEKMYFRQDKGEPVKLPIKWMAVESIEDGVFSEKSDVWSFGVTCWEVFSGGKIPYGGLPPLSIPRLLEEGHRMEKPLNTACSIAIYNNMMLRCWDANLQKRPTFSLLVKDIDKMVSTIADYLVMSLLDDSNTSDVSNSSTLSKSSSSVSSPLENQVEILILD